MEQGLQKQQDHQAMADAVSGRIARIAELKELLKTARGIPEEMSLLTDLTQEISALRQLLGVRSADQNAVERDLVDRRADHAARRLDLDLEAAGQGVALAGAALAGAALAGAAVGALELEVALQAARKAAPPASSCSS